MKLCRIKSCLYVVSLTILCDYTAGNFTRDFGQLVSTVTFSKDDSSSGTNSTWNPWSVSDTGNHSTVEEVTTTTSYLDVRNAITTISAVVWSWDNIKDSNSSSLPNMTTLVQQLPIIQSWIMNNSNVNNITGDFNDTVLPYGIEMLNRLLGNESVSNTGRPLLIRPDWILNTTQYNQGEDSLNKTTISDLIEIFKSFVGNDSTTFDILPILNSTIGKGNVTDSVTTNPSTQSQSNSAFIFATTNEGEGSPAYATGFQMINLTTNMPENGTYTYTSSLELSTPTNVPSNESSYQASTREMPRISTDGFETWTTADSSSLSYNKSSSVTNGWDDGNRNSTIVSLMEATPSATSASPSKPSRTTRKPNISTETPSKLSANSSSPWSGWPNGNHYNSIVNVNVDSGAESLDRFKRLEAMITKRMADMDKMTRRLASDLQSKIVQLQALLDRNASFDIQEIKNHMELLLNKKAKSLESQMKIIKCESKRDSNIVVDVTTTPTTVQQQQGTNEDTTLSEWRAARNRVMDRWEAHFQRGRRVDRNRSRRSQRRVQS